MQTMPPARSRTTPEVSSPPPLTSSCLVTAQRIVDADGASIYWSVSPPRPSRIPSVRAAEARESRFCILHRALEPSMRKSPTRMFSSRVLHSSP